MTRFKSDNLKPNTEAADVTRLESAIKNVKGVTTVNARAREGRIDVDHGSDVKKQDIKDAAKGVGFPLRESA
jgi:copper chaperone CopZ